MELGKSLFLFKFKNQKDKARLLVREPWHFDKNIVALHEIDGF